MQTFEEILSEITRACNRTFYRGVSGEVSTVINCATQIYIAQMETEKEKEENKK